MESILEWLETSWELGGGSDRRGDLREIQGSQWECWGPGWWWGAELELVAPLVAGFSGIQREMDLWPGGNILTPH